MTAESYEPFRQRLLQLRARLRGDMDGLSRLALRSSEELSGGDLSHVPTHLADHGTETFDQEFNLSLIENEEETLALIEAALERIEQGQYGTCVNCGKKIPKARLSALPFTPYCVACASKT